MSLISRRQCLAVSIWFMLSSCDGLSAPKLTSSSHRAANGGRFCLCIFRLFLVIGKSSERPGPIRGALCARRSEPLTARTVLDHGEEGIGGGSGSGPTLPQKRQICRQ